MIELGIGGLALLVVIVLSLSVGTALDRGGRPVGYSQARAQQEDQESNSLLLGVVVLVVFCVGVAWWMG
jgi:hypothetical protein